MKIDFNKKMTYLSITERVSSKGNQYAMLNCFDGDNSYNLYVPKDIIDIFRQKKFGDVLNLKLVATLGKFPKIEVAGLNN